VATFQCSIVTPDGPVFDGEVEMVVVPGSEGGLGVLARHAPIVAQLDVGEVRVDLGGKNWRAWATSDGYFEMVRNVATVLVEGAVATEDIDPARARALADDAAARLQAADAGDKDVDRFRAERDLQHAENQLRLAGAR